MDSTWQQYYERTHASGGAHATLLHALQLFKSENVAPGFAIDLGSGAGNDSAELLNQGWEVLAIDRERSALELLINRTPRDHMHRLNICMTDISSAKLPPAQLVNASLTLQFVPADTFTDVWMRIAEAISPKGRFAGHLLGLNDEWNGSGATTHFSEAEIRTLFDPFDIELIEPLEIDLPDVSSGIPKHWHIWNLVARKRIAE